MISPIFYHPSYLNIQKHPQLKIVENDHFKIIFSIQNATAHSLPLGLFGSFLMKKSNLDFQDLQSFWNVTQHELFDEKVKKIYLTHPVPIYESFVPNAWLLELGFEVKRFEINHHVNLHDYTIHKMEWRKIKKLNQLKCQIQYAQSIDELEKCYPFIAECRRDMGLEINISYDKLKALFLTFPDQYFIVKALLNKEVIAALIMVKINEKILYYFLPCTSQKYRKLSPMVLIMYEVYKKFHDAFQFLDLGISSTQGIPQKGLIAFKERMGGIRNKKMIYSYYF